MLPLDKGAIGAGDPEEVCGRRRLLPGTAAFEPKLEGFDDVEELVEGASVVPDFSKTCSCPILGEATIVSSLDREAVLSVCVPAPIPGAKLNLLVGTTTLSISCDSGSSVFPDCEAREAAFNDFNEGIVLPL